MNANELADWLDNYAANSYCHEFELSATMLRQQQAEIEALKNRYEPAKTLTDEGYEVVFDGEKYTTKLFRRS